MTDSNLIAAERTVEKPQVSITKMFWWTTLCGFAFGSISKFPDLFDAGFSGATAIPTTVLIVVSWLLFLAWYWEQKNHAAIVVHVAGIVLIFPLSLTVARNSILLISLATLLWSQVLSIIFGVLTALSNAIRRHGKPASHLVYCLVGGAGMVAAIFGSFASLVNGFLDLRAIAAGAMIGFWMGFYQAMAKSRWFQDCRILGVRTRPIATAGFLMSFFPPILIVIANATVLSGVYYVPVWFSPSLGFVAAIAVIVLWRTGSMFVAAREDPVDSRSFETQDPTV